MGLTSRPIRPPTAHDKEMHIENLRTTCICRYENMFKSNFNSEHTLCAEKMKKKLCTSMFSNFIHQSLRLCNEALNQELCM